MKSGMVSIITPAYNCAKFIEDTVACVIKQTYPNWEMLIVDDCSTDNTREVIEEIMRGEPRVKYLALEKNSGAAVARTRGMQEAEGEYIAFLDSDDIWLPEKLEKQIAFMQSNGYAFTCTSYEQVDENGKPLGTVRAAKEKMNYRQLLRSCPVGNSTVMYSVARLGKFTVPNIRKRNDYALWLTILKKEEYVRGLPEVLTQYRIRANSISRNKFSLIKYHWHLYHEIEKLGSMRSAFLVCYWCVAKVLKIHE